MKKISKLRGIRAEMLENEEMKKIFGGVGSGGSTGGDGGHIGSGAGYTYECSVQGVSSVELMASTMEECLLYCQGYYNNSRVTCKKK